jgi:serine/threonine protein kinase
MHGTTHIDPLLGTVLGGRYLLRECVVEGVRWRRYIAELEGRTLLVTTISGTLLADDAVARFRDVCSRLSGLDASHLGALIDFGSEPNGGLFIVESGEVWHDLEHELALKGSQRAERAIALVLQLLTGLDALHAAGLTHGGLCPAVLRLHSDVEGRPSLEVSPLGLALEAAYPRANADATPFQPPDKGTGVAADLFAAARLLELLLTGERDELAAERALRGREESLPVSVEQVFERCFSDEGFLSAAEMASVLGGDEAPSFGRYTLLHRLARGGMGEIFVARAEGIEGVEGTSRLCVIKTIRSNLASDPELVERFLGEVRVLASVSHGNLAPVYDVGRVGDTFYIAMEYVAGKDLHQLLRRAREQGERFPLPLALYIAREMANGLAYAHRPRSASSGLVHRDVSPQNSLISFEGEVKLIDFGLALGGHGRPTTREGVVLGKLCYISPEQARAEPLDRRTDIYSLGLVLFEMLVGEPFFNQQTVDEVMQHVACPEAEPPSARQPEIPDEVDQICLRAMSADREQRYGSAEELRDDLAAALARLAPRTNPEEVGALVAHFFPDAEEQEERLMSDLSGTLPLIPAMASTDQGPTDEQPVVPAPGERVPAASLLAPAPTPVALQSNLIPLESITTEPRASRDAVARAVTEPDRPAPLLPAATTPSEMDGAKSTLEVDVPAEAESSPSAPSAVAPAATDPELAAELARWEQSQGHRSSAPIGRLVAIFALVVVILGSGVGILLYRHYAARRSAKALEGLQLAMHRKPRRADAGAKVNRGPDAASTVTAVPRAKPRRYCVLRFDGGRPGMRISVDNERRELTKGALKLIAGRRYRIMIRYGRFRPWRQKIFCRANIQSEYILQFRRRR